jgi:hypothetical protein
MKNASIPRDRSKIILDSENQVRHWTRHLGRHDRSPNRHLIGNGDQQVFVPTYRYVAGHFPANPAASLLGERSAQR